MRLLFDQNISVKVVKQLLEFYPESTHVLQSGLVNATDFEIWEYVKQHNFSIVTFDSDFNDFSILFGHPPKVIWLRIGNTTTKNLVSFFIEKQEHIKAFLRSPENSEISCLEFN